MMIYDCCNVFVIVGCMQRQDLPSYSHFCQRLWQIWGAKTCLCFGLRYCTGLYLHWL